MSKVITDKKLDVGYQNMISTIEFFNCDIWILPFFHSNHWMLFVIDNKNKNILYLDSLKKNPEEEWIQNLCSFIMYIKNKEGKDVFNCSLWKLIVSKDIPQQNSKTNNCGVFICT